MYGNIVQERNRSDSCVNQIISATLKK